MRLSIAMIVKNEEKYLEQCLLSTEKLKNKIDYELIIIDTGSTDNTMSIARKFTDNVYEEKWNDNFSYMRNLSIGYCKGDWILILDADEILQNPDELIRILQSDDIDNYNSIGIYQKNLLNGMDLEDYSITNVFRLLKRSDKFKFEGTIHEQPNIIYPRKESNITLLHYGYNKSSFEKITYRNERNKKLLLKELQEGNMDKVYVLFQLCRTFLIESDKSKAFRYINRAYNTDKCVETHCHLSVYKQLATQLFYNGEYRRCIDVFNEIKEYFIEDLDYYYFCSMSYFRLGIYHESEKLFNEYFKLYDRKKQGKSFISMSGEDSIKCIDGTKVNFAKCLFKQKKYNDVINVYESFSNDIAKEKFAKEYIYSSIVLHKYDFLNDYLITNYNDVKMNQVAHVLDDLYGEDFNLQELLGVNEYIDKYISIVYLDDNKYDLKEFDFGEYYLWKGRIILKSILVDGNNLSYLEGLSINDSYRYINYVNNNYNTIKTLLAYVNENYLSLYNSKRNLVYAIQKVLLYNQLVVGDKYDKLIKQSFVSNCILLNNFIHSSNYINENMDFVEQMLDNYSALWIDIYRILKNINVSDSISMIKKSLKCNPRNTRIVEYFISDKIVNSNNSLIQNEELNTQKNKIIKVVEDMVSDNEIIKAFEIIDELFNMYPYDSDILLIRGVILYLLHRSDEALINLSLSYILLEDKFEAAYNIAMILEDIGQIEASIEYYNKSYEMCKDEELKKDIKLKIETLR